MERLIAEEAEPFGLGRDVDDAPIHRGVDPDIIPLVGVQALEQVFRRRGGRSRARGPVVRPGTDAGRRIDRLRGRGDRAIRSFGPPRICARGGRRSPNRSPKRTATRIKVTATVAACARTGLQPIEIGLASFMIVPPKDATGHLTPVAVYSSRRIPVSSLPTDFPP